MIVYITGTLTAVLLAYVSTHVKKECQISVNSNRTYSKLFAFLSFVPLTFIMAVRYNVGTDYPSYSIIYTQNLTLQEEGFNQLNKLLHKITYNPQILFIVTSVIICAGYFIAIYRESLVPEYSILLFVIVKDYFISMNVVRQYIAIAIIFFAVPYIKRKEFIKVVIILFIAIQFHRSALIVAAVVILYNFEIKPLAGLGIMISVFLVSPLIRNIVYSFLSKFGLYSNYFLSSSVFSNMDQVFNWQYTIVTLGPFLILCYEYKRVIKNSNLKLLYTATLVSLILMSLSSAFPTLITRLVWYMNVFVVLYLPEAINNIPNKRIKLFVNIATISLYTIVAIRNIIGGAQSVLPYQTFWNK